MMILTSERGTHSRWRMFLICMMLLGLVSRCELSPTGRAKDSDAPAISLAGRSRMRKSQDIGSPSELAWQAWLLLDTQSGGHSSLDSASLLRRITPKSVFIAPALTACPDGYQADKMGRCVRNFNIDEKAHTSFLLQRLNVKFAENGPLAGFSSASKAPREPSGPLQLNIPLLSNADTVATAKVGHEEPRDSLEVPVVVPPQGGTHSDEKKEPQEAVVTVYEVKNDTASEEGESMFFLGNTSASAPGAGDEDSPTKADAVVPVVEFVDEANKTDFPGVVDYKIPIALKTIFNASGIKNIDVSGDQEFSESASDATNSTDDSPKLVLLLSPTKLPFKAQPSDVEDLENAELADEKISGPVIIRVSNVTANVSDNEMISVSLPQSMMPPLKKLSDIPLLVVDKLENETHDEGGAEEHVADSPQDTEPLYDDEEEDGEDEDYLDSTDNPLYEESGEAEGDEILKHSEAGMTIPVKSLERFHLEKQRQQAQRSNETRKNETAKVEPPSESSLGFNESRLQPPDEKDEPATKISSEVSINGDVIQETTLLDVNTERPKNNRKSPERSSATLVAGKHHRHKEEPHAEKESNRQPEVVFSPQDVHGTASSGLHGRKRAGQKAEMQSGEKSDEMEAAPSSSETLLYDPVSDSQFRQEDPITEIHTIDTQYTINKDPVPEAVASHKGSVPESSAGILKSLASELRPTQGYPDFPSYVRQSMRLYSEEANSIHNQDYKERVPYRLDEGLHSGTKSSVHIHQKPSYLFMPSWRSDRQQISAQQVHTTATSPRQKHPPVFLHFWTHMPLVVDPSLSSPGQGPRAADAHGGQRYPNSKFLQAPPPPPPPPPPSSARRTHFYKDASPPDLNMSFAQKLRTLIGG